MFMFFMFHSSCATGTSGRNDLPQKSKAFLTVNEKGFIFQLHISIAIRLAYLSLLRHSKS